MCVYFENVASQGQLVKDRNKDRSRSKSPFRSFRWKKSPQKSPLSAVSASDDEATSVELTSGIVVLKNRFRFLEIMCKSHAWYYNISYTDKNKHGVYLSKEIYVYLCCHFVCILIVYFIDYCYRSISHRSWWWNSRRNTQQETWMGINYKKSIKQVPSPPPFFISIYLKSNMHPCFMFFINFEWIHFYTDSTFLPRCHESTCSLISTCWCSISIMR